LSDSKQGTASSATQGQPASVAALRDGLGQLDVATNQSGTSTSSDSALTSHVVDSFWTELFNSGVEGLGI
jgi:hypothetical protein